MGMISSGTCLLTAKGGGDVRWEQLKHVVESLGRGARILGDGDENEIGDHQPESREEVCEKRSRVIYVFGCVWTRVT